MSLVSQGDDPCHTGCTDTRPADLEPPLLPLVSRRIVDGHAGARISIPGHVRRAPLASAVIHIGGGSTVAALVAWLRLIRAGPSASPTPDLLTSIAAAGAATAATPGRPVHRQRHAPYREPLA